MHKFIFPLVQVDDLLLRLVVCSASPSLHKRTEEASVAKPGSQLLLLLRWARGEEAGLLLSSPSVPCPCGRHLSPARWTNLRESFVPKSLLGAHLLLRKGNEIMLFVAFLQKTMISIFPEGTSVLPSPKRQRSCGKTLRQLLLLLLDPSLLRSLRLRHWRRREEIHNFHPGGGDFRYVVHCPRGDTAAKMVWMDGGNRPPSRSMEGRGICYVTNKDNNIPFDRLNARAAGEPTSGKWERR